MAENNVNDNPKRSILIPIDGSKHCDRAFLWYQENLHKEGDIVYFIHIVEPDYDAAYYQFDPSFTFKPIFEETLDNNIAEGKELCRKYMTRAKEMNIHHRAFTHLSSRPGEALVESIKDHEVDMIVMGNRGVGKLHRKILGSVSDYVVHHAHKPIIVCNPETHKLRKEHFEEQTFDSGHENDAFDNDKSPLIL